MCHSLPKEDVKAQIKAAETWMFGTSSSEASNPASQATANQENAIPAATAAESSTGTAPRETDSPNEVVAPQGVTESASSSKQTSLPEAALDPQPAPVQAKPAPAQVAVPVPASTPTQATQPVQPVQPAPIKHKEHSNPIAMAAAAIGLGHSHTGGSSSGGSSPDGSSHHHSLFKRSQKKHSSSISASGPDHVASSRQLPPSQP